MKKEKKSSYENRHNMRQERLTTGEATKKRKKIVPDEQLRNRYPLKQEKLGGLNHGEHRS